MEIRFPEYVDRVSVVGHTPGSAGSFVVVVVELGMVVGVLVVVELLVEGEVDEVVGAMVVVERAVVVVVEVDSPLVGGTVFGGGVVGRGNEDVAFHQSQPFRGWYRPGAAEAAAANKTQLAKRATSATVNRRMPTTPIIFRAEGSCTESLPGCHYFPGDVAG